MGSPTPSAMVTAQEAYNMYVLQQGGHTQFRMLAGAFYVNDVTVA